MHSQPPTRAEVFTPAPGGPLSSKVYFQTASTTSDPEELNWLQVCLIRVRAHLCRTVSLEELG